GGAFRLGDLFRLPHPALLRQPGGQAGGSRQEPQRMPAAPAPRPGRAGGGWDRDHHSPVPEAGARAGHHQRRLFDSLAGKIPGQPGSLMMLLAFVAETDIEHQILKAQDGALSGDALLRRLADADLFVPSTGEVQTDGSGFQPVLIDQDGSFLVVVFTAPSRQPKDMATCTMQMNGRQFFQRLPAGYGVMINPGYDAQILVPPHGMAALKQDLAGR